MWRGIVQATRSTDDSIVTIINPKEDGMTLELEFYDEMMEGVEGEDARPAFLKLLRNPIDS